MVLQMLRDRSDLTPSAASHVQDLQEHLVQLSGGSAVGEQAEEDVVVSRLRSEKEGVVLVSVSHIPDEKSRPALH